ALPHRITGRNLRTAHREVPRRRPAEPGRGADAGQRGDAQHPARGGGQEGPHPWLFQWYRRPGAGRARGFREQPEQTRPDGPRPGVIPRLAIVSPPPNPALNALSALPPPAGYLAIRRKRVTLHKTCMLTALVVSAVFLGCYLYYHLVIQQGKPTYFAERAPEAPVWVGRVYLALLLSHTLLAVLVPFLALYTIWQGLRSEFTKHVRVARWTLPIWLYVSVTGVLVYWMLFRMYPGP